MHSSFPSAHDAPAFVPYRGGFSLLTEDGELLHLSAQALRERLAALPPALVVHAPALARRLGLPAPGQPAPWLDLLELFAFVHPARPAVPTPRGLALALGLDVEGQETIEADLLPNLLATLLNDLRQRNTGAEADSLAAFCLRMAQAGWPWAGTVAETLELETRLTPRGTLPEDALQPADALRVWRTLPKWEESAPRPPPASHAITPLEVRARLAHILGEGAESRAGQADFANVCINAFEPRSMPGDPAVLLAEAGTGTGKTLGYIAPASVWAERNDGAVWVSTYTRHLQRQIEQETRRLYPDSATHRQKVVLRKGRENYLCLLNMEEAVNTAASRPAGVTIALAMLARWALATADGDLMGGDLPGWFGDLFGQGNLAGVADRRGECIHGACPHYQRCFVEHGIRRAKDADLVIANHALVMAQAAYAQAGISDDAANSPENAPPSRYVFDEGHHLADAADSAFSAELSGLEAAELRRWLLGAEGRRSRARGLKRRLDDLVVGHPKLETPLDAALTAAHALPSPGWSTRLTAEDTPPESAEPDLPPVPEESFPATLLLPPDAPTAQPIMENPTEVFLRLLRQQSLARAHEGGRQHAQGGTLECDLHPLVPGLAEAGQQLSRALTRLVEPLRTLCERLRARLEDDADSLDSPTRIRIEAMTRALHRRAIARLDAWLAMLAELEQTPDAQGHVPSHVHFIRLERRERQRMGEQDVGLHRHWIDPTIPFAATMAIPAQGMLITSATLRDHQPAPPTSQPDDSHEADDAERTWEAAEARTGANHFPSPAIRASLASPFNYQAQTRVFIVTDVDNSSIVDLSAAFRTLFMASGGGALGLFTAISRLRGVHERIAPTLEENGLPLYAQHVDAMDNNTLVDIFRTEEHACLLGTDAMRDGVDVPGNALRLVVFERVPWPRPDILHRERRIHLAGGDPKGFDDAIARLRLRQAFGRLIRRQSDRGVFVLLDRRAPSRLLSAFPGGVETHRAGLAETARAITAFLHAEPDAPTTDSQTAGLDGA
ncbi:ATP-dependent DNA helicase [Acetobacter suratthaniensis]|uniref:ATP-dependent DNA helicase n=1 Tax=Acetobacter suratthaniensis TaxID=1502841 RepID=A0ABS3LKU5_9PROT|nr:ATP-dependent DNA helicase [Acetobacter suratthaniensis]MBO1327720.1 ATP-dependent DNA helicase [Acetobacter suratthaniensis]MCX2565702.1 ATP-dependent DNA helicase [Acetobacter suratthaniensis]